MVKIKGTKGFQKIGGILSLQWEPLPKPTTAAVSEIQKENARYFKAVYLSGIKSLLRLSLKSPGSAGFGAPAIKSFNSGLDKSVSMRNSV